MGFPMIAERIASYYNWYLACKS